MIKKVLLTIVLGGSMAAMAACGGDAEEKTNEEAAPQEETAAADEATGEQPEMPEPDLKDIPDVVAEVNGEEIDKKEFESVYTGQFQQMAMQAQMSGQEVDQAQLKEQIAESLVAQELLVQETEKQKIEVTDEQTDASLKELAEQNGLASSEEFLAALEEQGLSEEEVRKQVQTQVKVDQLVAQEAGEIKPTEEELKKVYEQAQAQQKEAGSDEELPAFEEVKPQLEEQVKMQKESEAVQGLIAKLRESADVTINL